MTESPKLLPCPLCGCPIKHGMTKRGRCQLHGEPITGHRVWCESCGMSVEYGSYELAKKFWNKRAPDPEREAMVRNMRDVREALDDIGTHDHAVLERCCIILDRMLERARKGEG